MSVRSARRALDPIKDLVRQWRKEALRPYGLPKYQLGDKETLLRCADDLAVAIAKTYVDSRGRPIDD